MNRSHVARPSSRLACALAALAALCAVASGQHTIDEVKPFHLSAGDSFTAQLGGVALGAGSTVVVQLTPLGGGAAVDATVEETVSTGRVDARLPGSIAVGQYTCSVSVDGTANVGPNPSVWVKERTLQFVRRTAASATLDDPPLPAGVSHSNLDFKEVDFADIDNDGSMDAYAANSPNGSTSNLVDGLYVNQVIQDPAACSDLFCQDIGARVALQAGVSNNRTYDADFADIDRDGDLDLVRSDNDSSFPLRFFVNDGDGTFTERTQTSGAITGLAPSSSGIIGNTAEIDIGDVDGDAWPDILTSSWGGNLVGLFLNRLTTTGRFEPIDYDCGGGSPHALCATQTPSNRGSALGDFNVDGMLDIIALDHSGAGAHLVFLNTGNDASGDPQFSTNSNWVVESDGSTVLMTDAGDLKVADLDGDGDHDVAITAPGQAGADHGTVLWNDAGTKLVEVASTRLPSVGDTYDVAFSDVDRDGDLDVVFATEFDHAGNNIVLVNRGGTDEDLKFEELADVWYEEQPFGDPPIPDPSPDFDLSVSLADYDLDGDADLLGAGFANVGLWENTLFSDAGESRDWVFALDRTRSMISGGHDFFEPAKNVIEAFLAERNAGDLVALVTYDYAGSDPMNVCAADTEGGVDVKAQKEFLLGAMDNVSLAAFVDSLLIGSCTGYCTSVGAGLDASLEVAALGDPSREKVIVIATDGRNNQCPAPETVVPTIPSNVRVYVVALGTGTDDGALSDLATNEGKFYVAGRSDDYTSVQSALREIDADLEAHSTGKQVLLPVSSLILRSWLSKIRLPDLFLRDRRGLDDDVTGVRRVHYFAVDPADRVVRFTLSWRNASQGTRMIVTDPAGRTHPMAGSDLSGERVFAKAHVVEVLDPLSGIWTIEEAPAGDPGPTKVTGLATGDLVLGAGLEGPLAYLNEDLRIVAELAVRGRPMATAQITATFLSPSEVSITVAGEPGAAGRWNFTLPKVAEEGTWRATLTAVGTPARPFVRTWHEAIHVRAARPEEPDLGKLQIEMDRPTLIAGGLDSATVTLRAMRRDGAPLVGALVSFWSDLGELEGVVQDLGNGSYSQEVSARESTGEGRVRPRIGARLLVDFASFKVVAGPVDPRKSMIDIGVGPQVLCAGHVGRYRVTVRPMDGLGNPLTAASVAIDASGGALTWTGPVQRSADGSEYAREFEGPASAGAYVFRALVDGVAIDTSATLQVFDPDSPEGRLIGCAGGGTVEPPRGIWPWWIWLLILFFLLMIALLVKRALSK